MTSLRPKLDTIEAFEHILTELDGLTLEQITHVILTRYTVDLDLLADVVDYLRSQEASRSPAQLKTSANSRNAA